MESKKINIVTINLNNKDGLEKTIKSVVEQTYFDKVNYIVIDGESTDGSVDIIKQYDDKISHWVSEKDNGVYSAMNKGVDLCKSEYVLFLNSGDYLSSNNVIEEVYDELDGDIVYGNLYVATSRGVYLKKYPKRIKDIYFKNESLPHPGSFIRTECLKKYRYSEKYSIISDWIFFYEGIVNYGLTYKHIETPISVFKLGGLSSNVANVKAEKEKYYNSLKYDCKIGVVIPCYNSEKYIEKTIDSLKKQTFVDWKCVIVNDGSTDNSEEIILKCIDGDKRFSYIKQENQGVPPRNIGIRSLNSKYIFCLDADDIINENYFSKGVEFLDSNPDYSVFYGNAKFLYDDGTTKDWKLPEYSYTRLLRGNIIYCSFLYRRSDYEKTDGYDETMKGFEDWDFLIRLLKNAGKVYKSKSVLFYYRRHEGSMDKTYNRGDNRIKMINYIFDKNRDVYEYNGIDINFLLKPYVKKKETKKVCVSIFTYKENLESYEKLSFLKCLNVFGRERDIKLVIPDNISTEYYDKYSNLFEIVKVNASWMDDIKSYNQMLCNSKFWKMFNDYEYVLTYQTDCWAYEDKLDYFIGLGYDYYGAPWPIYDNKVGNGGLSLRKVSKMIEITEKYEFIRGSINEDGWFCLKHADEINICPVEIAANFSLEIPSISILKMVKDVPMGLHGKYLMNLLDENGDNFRKYNRLKMVQMKKLALIIPTKDNSESLLRLLYSIVYRTEYDKANLALYIVDNGSKESEKNKVIEHINRVIKEYGYNIKFYETDNYTLPQLYNFVVNEKVDADTDLLLFCTDNVELTNDCISNLVNNWSEQCGTLGARLMLEDNTIQHIGYNIKKDNFTCYDVVQKQVLPAEYRNTKINVYGNSNSFMLTSFALWKQLNGFDEKYKSNFFDIDYSIKALLNGKNSYNITGAVCWYHKAIKSKYAKRDENRISKRIKEYLTIIDETSKKE